MNSLSKNGDIFNVVAQQVGATGLSAKVEILRGVEQLRSCCARVSFYAAVGVLVEDDQEHLNCAQGIARAMPGLRQAIEILVGRDPVPGLDPAALKWVRDVASELSESCVAVKAFVALAHDLEEGHQNRTNKTKHLTNFTKAAAGPFNTHFGAIMNRLSDELQAHRTAQRDAADTTALAAQKAMAEISDVSRQVGMIAINASIEAAHVGDQGKGFAIIAAEIREMSAQIERANQRVQDRMADMVTAISNS